MAMTPQPTAQALDKICLQKAKACDSDPVLLGTPLPWACIPVTCPLRELRWGPGRGVWRRGGSVRGEVVDRLCWLSCWLLCNPS